MPSIGGHSCCTPDTAPVGPYEQAKAEDRADVLVYSTHPLAKPIEVTGPVQVVLYAASSAPDTDFTAKLVDVYPDGKAYNLGNGVIRASSRRSLDSAWRSSQVRSTSTASISGRPAMYLLQGIKSGSRSRAATFHTMIATSIPEPSWEPQRR